ncbi:hypothetical protein PTKIN_Ptkin06aG0153300 [Pterospermum kingtungense]
MPRYYQYFEPDYRYRQGEAYDVIELQVKDFRMEQLKVYFGSNRVLTISGERSLQGTPTPTWIRFRKEFNTPNCNKANEIRARLNSGILYIAIPKQISQQEQDPLTPVQEATSDSIQDKGKLKQENSQSKEDDEVCPDEQSSGARDVMTKPIENATLLKAAPKYFILRLKIGRKTAVKVVASVALLFTMLFCMYKYYAPLIMRV